MKKIIALFTVLVCLLTACSQSKPVEMPANSSEVVTIVSDAGRLSPQVNWIYSFQNNLSADGQRLYYKDIVPLLTEADQVSAPFTIELHDAVRQIRYTIYDNQGNELAKQRKKLTLPEEAGEYVCVLWVSYGTDDDYTGVQFFFSFTI